MSLKWVAYTVRLYVHVIRTRGGLCKHLLSKVCLLKTKGHKYVTCLPRRSINVTLLMSIIITVHTIHFPSFYVFLTNQLNNNLVSDYLIVFI
jgi:hypothetical protein